MAGDQWIAAFGGDRLEPPDGLDGYLGADVDPPTDCSLHLDVLRQVGGVEGEHETAATHRFIQVDDETLMARRMSCGQHRGHPGAISPSPSARRQSMVGSS